MGVGVGVGVFVVVCVGVGVSPEPVGVGVGVGVVLPVGVGAAVGAAYFCPPVVTTISNSLSVASSEEAISIPGKSELSAVFISAATLSNPVLAATDAVVRFSGAFPVLILSRL